MYERMLNKAEQPDEQAIRETLGPEAYARLNQFEAFLNANYSLTHALKFPFGNKYGWGYKYGHKSKHLCYAFFEEGAFTVMLQLGDDCVPALIAQLDSLLLKTRELWAKRYPCGEQGGWLHYRVLSDDDLVDVCKLIQIKLTPRPPK